MKNLILSIGFILVLLSYCTDNRTITGNEFPFRTVNELVHTATVYPTETEVLKFESNAGDGYYLMLGESENYSSSILIKFAIDSTVMIVNRAVVSFYTYGYAGKVNETFECGVYKIDANSVWNEDEIPEITYDPVEIATYTVSTSSAERDSIIIPNEIIEGWIADSTTNKGILIKPKNAGYFKKYYSWQTINYATLKIIGWADEDDMESEEETTTYRNPSMDSYIYTSTFEPQEKELVVDDLSIYRSLIKFDSIGIPENATINKAILEIYLQHDRTKLMGNDDDLIFVSRITNDSRDPETIEFDTDDLSTFYGQQKSDFATDELFRINITGMLQQWLSGLEENYGMLMISYNEKLSAGRYVFPADSLTSEKRIKVLVNYSLTNVQDHF